MGEMSSTSIENCIKYSNPAEKELSMVFSFHHLKVDYKNGNKWELMPYDKAELKNLLRSWQEGMSKAGGWNAVFWTNHDQPRTISRFGSEDKYWKESGKLFAGIIHLMRGTPYIYQGEEIGMLNTHFTDISQYRDVESLNYYNILLDEGKTKEEALNIINQRSRDNCRTPMQWDSSVNDGFSKGEPWIEVPSFGKAITVESQLDDEDSILSFYKKLIRLRKENVLVSQGDIKFITDVPEDVIAYERSQDDKHIVVLGNLSEEEIKLDGLHVLKDKISRMHAILNNYNTDATHNNNELLMRPYEFVVFSN